MKTDSGEAKEAISRGVGVTSSEALLAELADSTFLDLWSYPNVFKVPGKELCDLLVVCGDDIIIFSDKTIGWPPGDLSVAWPRWYKRAISKSVDQIRGAVRWLETKPSEVFLDAKCNDRLPIELPPPDRRRIHGVCVALGAEEAAATYFDDPDGTFLILPHLKGERHIEFGSEHHMPFAIGDVDPAGPFIHVFNQSSLEVVMSELNTISDFMAYLKARAELIRTELLRVSPSESEVLANYLQLTQNGVSNFPRPSDLGADEEVKFAFVQGEYAYLVESEEYQLWKQSDKVSYAWDTQIRLFTEHVLKGTSYKILGVDPEASLAERALRFMAQEGRLRRRVLGHTLMGALQGHANQAGKGRFSRVVFPDENSIFPGLAYVFMVLSDQEYKDYETYRSVRASMLETYCASVLFDHREMKVCVGIALSGVEDDGSSEDLIAMEQHLWTSSETDSLRTAREAYEILVDPAKLKRAKFSPPGFPFEKPVKHEKDWRTRRRGRSRSRM
ncbi:hypothetical protein [Caulobacter radicis]|uniref:hypothetical protein n=1 Tax=Caulobacter radicis TaxID=2172650 RepID=UPI00105799EF|nr:hypothetical protein [Caulobacter radicis]